MNLNEVEAKVKILAETVAKLEARLKTAEDIEEIKKLQRIYGFYLTHWMGQEIVDLFSNDPDVCLVLIYGKFLGKEGIGKYFLLRKQTPELLFAMMQLSGVIDVAPDGKTAKGRWFGYSYQAVPVKKGVRADNTLGVYENEYVKEDGKWKFKKVEFRLIISCPFGECWVAPEKLVSESDLSDEEPFKPDLPFTTDEEMYSTRYPSGRILPFHYKHPITGK
jgi:SnoaL-like domain